MASEGETVELTRACKTVSEAAREGNLNEIKRLVEEGHPVDGKDNRGWRPWHEAADSDYTDCLTFLLQQKDVDVNAVSFEEQTALYLAAYNMHIDSMKILLEHKADPNISDNFQVTALYKAVESGWFEGIKLLVENGADVNCQNFNHTTPLHRAAAKGKAKLVEYLLEHGARLDLCEDYNITPIFSAAQYGYPKCLHLMLKAAEKRGELAVANVCASDGACPLFLAAQEGHAACVRMLLHYNANANLMTHEPKALPLHAALQFARLECLELLLGHTDQKLLTRCDPNLWELATRDRKGVIIQRILQLGLNIDARLPVIEAEQFRPRVFSHYGHVRFSRRVSALAAVALYRNPIANAEVLLTRNARLNFPNAYQVPPLLPAIDKQSYGLAELLIAYGASIDVYHPLIIGNICLVLAFPWWRGLTMLLKSGAEVESLFQWRAFQSVIHEGSSGDAATTDIEVTEPESSEEESTEPPTSPSKRRKASRHKPLTLHHTLRAASYSMKTHDVSIGKVLYRLLQFARNVSLAPDLESLLESKEEWKELLSITENVRPLKHYCRWKIRQSLGSQNLLKIDPVEDLKLPTTLTEYVMYADME